ncbi:aspartic peptidase domain-containing protein [Cladorrhinum sp. PSN259]|nr:aspartic peptidase domain-containing protein [Cladorrhinum sp. PSN259]
MGRIRFTAPLVALISFIATSSNAAEVLEIPFTTDTGFFNGGSFGPDGPWQAAAIVLGATDRDTLALNKTKPTWAAVYPSSLSFTQLLTTEMHGPELGAVYNITRSEALERMTWGEFGNNGTNIMLRTAGAYGNQLSEGVGLRDNLTFLDFGLREPGYANVNAYIYAMNDTRVFMKQKKKYVPKVGMLGLGRPADGQLTMAAHLKGDGLKGDGLIDQMKKNGIVGSNSFGMHLGSVSLRQKGSLAVGGYDATRVVGPVGVFDMQFGTTMISLLDVVLGSEVGGWPYDTPEKDIGGVFQGTDDKTGLELVQTLRRKKGSILVNINPAVPGIYMPNTTCANIAKHLPLTYNKTLGYYGYWLWDTKNPAYSRIVNSPAYLGFVLSDSSATNITIKIPFKLLNLTLEDPIVETPTQYFPCHDSISYSTGAWDLGRAFLQAAFYGANYDRNVTFLAQAPGPTGDQSVTQAIKPEDKTLVSKPASYFADSWTPHWTVLPGPKTESDTTNPADNSISGGSIAGIVVGTLAGVGLLGAAAWFLWKRKQQSSQKPTELEDEERKDYVQDFKVDPNYVPELGGNGKKFHEMAETPLVSEIADTPIVSELYSPRNLQELESPLVISEVPGSAVVYEMPGNETWIQRESRKSMSNDRK